MPHEPVRRILGEGPLTKITPYTIDSVERLLAELDEVRCTGIAISRQEAILGVGAVAAGITNVHGRCIAGLNVVYPIHLVPEQEIEQLGRLTVQAARRIAQQLGGLSLDGSAVTRALDGAQTSL